LEEAGKRVVRTVMLWWMNTESDFGGPLPENMVLERSNMWWVVGDMLSSEPLKSLPIIP
jgi:hypothetical protein